MRKRMVALNVARQSYNVLQPLAKLYAYFYSYDITLWEQSIWLIFHSVDRIGLFEKLPNEKFIYANCWVKNKSSLETIFNQVTRNYTNLSKSIIRTDCSLAGYSSFVNAYFKWLSKQLAETGQVDAVSVHEKLQHLRITVF